MAYRKCSPGRILRCLPFIVGTIAFIILLILAIRDIVSTVDDYRRNEVATIVKLHRNESVYLPDTAVCAPLSFMTQDPRLVLAAKHALLHDPTFLSKALHLDNDTAAQRYWDWKNSDDRTSLSPEGLIESFVNETLKPFLKGNISFPEENAIDKMMAQQADVYDIVETASGSLVNKTVLLASVVLIDVITGYGQGRQSANSMLAESTTELTEEELNLVAVMVKQLLKNPVIADQFSLNVARTLCEIFSPEWQGNLDGGAGSIDMCGTILKTPFYISLNQFCFNVPISATPFTKASPTGSLSLNLPLAQTVFSFGPLSQYFNKSVGNLTGILAQPTPQSPEISFPILLNSSSEETETNETISFSEQAGGGTSLLGFNLPFALPHQDALNLTSLLLNGTNEMQEKLQRQLDDLLHTDLLSLALKFPIVKPRTVSVYFPNDLRYYEAEDQTAGPGLLGLLGLSPPASLVPKPEDFYSKVFNYVLSPTELVEPGASAIFGVTESRSILSESESCSNEVSVAACLKKCILTNTQSACGCVPFGTHRLIDNSLESKNFRFCQLEDQQCISQVKEPDSTITNETTIDCKSKCRSVCSATKYKWRDSRQKPGLAALGGNINAMLTGQPTHWTWNLACDAFDYIEYVDQVLITQSQLLAQIGGILGFYGTIFGAILLLMYLIKKLGRCCCGRRNDAYDVTPIIVKDGSFDYGRPAVINGDLRKAIEDAVKAEIMKLKYEYPEKTATNGRQNLYQTLPVKAAEYGHTRNEDYEIPKDAYVSRFMIGQHDN